MGIGPAETKRADPCPPRQRHTSLIPQRLPWLCLVHDVQGRGQFDFRVQRLKVDRFGKCLMLQAQQHLDQARDPSRTLQMADIGFDRAQTAGVALETARV